MKPLASTLASPRRRRLLTGSVASAALVVLGCGGGDDFAGIGTGGTGSFTSGTIRAFGSIVVNGIHYDESRAAITDDAGQTLGRSALQLGMVVEVEGSDISTSTSGVRRADASAVRVRSELQGPIAAIDLAGSQITVLGQQVSIGASTVFERQFEGGLSSLTPGQEVEIYGLRQADGQYLATRIESAHDAAYKLRGRISALNPSDRSFRMGGAVISYAGLDLGGQDLANGRYARVQLRGNAHGPWTATAIRVAPSGINAPSTGSIKAEIEGYITDFTSNTRFSVNGMPVDASQVSRLPAGLGLGVRVEVEGRLEDGVLRAHDVELKGDDDEFEIEAAVTHLDTQAQRLTLAGLVTVDYTRARFNGGTPGQLQLGSRLEVEGYLAADGHTLIATEVEFEHDEVELEGVISDLNRANRSFLIAGVVPVDYSQARFKGGRESDLAAGRPVEVEGYLAVAGNSVVLMAHEIEFEDDDDDIDELEIEGAITDMDPSRRELVIAGLITVDYTSARFKDGQVGDLRIGARIEAEGRVDSNGILRAKEIEFEDDIEIEGYISSLHTGSQRLVVGQLVEVDYAQARFKDGSPAGLHPGLKIEASGRLSADGLRLQAREVEFDD